MSLKKNSKRSSAKRILVYLISIRIVIILGCLLIFSLKSESQNSLNDDDLIRISTIRADSLPLVFINSDSLDYRYKLLIALRLFDFDKSDTNATILGDLIPNNQERARSYWGIDKCIWMERSLKFFKQEFNVEAEKFYYMRLNSFFKLVLIKPDLISDMYLFTLYSRNNREVEEFSDFYLSFISEYEGLFFNTIKLLPRQDANYIVKLINEFADYEALEDVKKKIKRDNLTYLNLPRK